MRGLKDKIAIVTGGPGNLGRVVCKRLAEEGCKLMIADIAVDKAEAFAEELRTMGYEAAACSLNLLDEASVQAMVDTAVATYGTVDILVNMAYGVQHQVEDSMVPFTKMRPEFFAEVLRTNTVGYMMTCQKVLPIFLKKQSGTIVNFSSTAAIEGNVCRFAYSASKAGIITLGMNIACAYGQMGVRCNSILPGFMTADDGDIQAGYPGDIGIAMRESMMTPDVGRSSDIAAVVAFLASEDSKFINGESIIVDGGHHLPNPAQAAINMNKEVISPFYPRSYKPEDYPNGWTE